LVEAILQAAARVFAAHGYARATTNHIAAAAGISVGSLYQYFPSKDAIAVELLRRYRGTLVELVRRHVEAMAETTFESVVRALFTALLRGDGIDPSLHRVLIERVLRTSARSEIVGFEERVEEALTEALRHRQAPKPEITAFIVVRSVLGVVQAAVVDRPDLNGPELADEMTRLVVRYLAP
jgi:AcrR family transcriptional regulator